MDFKLVSIRLNGDLEEPINKYLLDYLPYNKKWEEDMYITIEEVALPTCDDLGIIRLNNEFEVKYYTARFEYVNKLVVYFYNDTSIVLSE